LERAVEVVHDAGVVAVDVDGCFFRLHVEADGRVGRRVTISIWIWVRIAWPGDDDLRRRG
jgi:hypothetical protein